MSQDKEINVKVPSVLAAAASLVVPGLGQALARQIRRGFLILLSFITMTAILHSLAADLGRRAGVGWPALVRAFERRPAFMVMASLILLALWLLGIYDAYRCAKDKKKPSTGIFALILIGFFIQGWQISEIDLVKMVKQAPEALPPLSRIMWPWDAAFERDTEVLDAKAMILAGEGEAPVRETVAEGQPYIMSEPNFGELSQRDKNNQMVPGTRIKVSGSGFEPNRETEIWWEDPIGNEFRPRENGQYLILTTDSQGSFEFEMTMPYQLTPPSAKGPFYHTLEARQITPVGPLKASEALLQTIDRMVETIFMGMMATVFGIIFSIPISFLAARNIMAGSKVTMFFYYLTRTILNIVRSIEPLIWALIAVVWVGLGPFAGIVALTLHTIAALGKLYSEAIEGIDQGPIEAIQATGASRLQTIMFAVIPQMISPFISFSIYRWDINVRMSTVIGMVGGGGIGFLLVQYIRLLDYRSAGIAVWFIAVTVAILDYVSAEIRNKLM
ncbi:MAG: phosphonate ABC transporter, permease protein PhnE [Spirochaetales bacterium]|nr:phosphonate ABC transporter, permease protein PhnE [Spirochaetales bacterium]